MDLCASFSRSLRESQSNLDKSSLCFLCLFRRDNLISQDEITHSTGFFSPKHHQMRFFLVFLLLGLASARCPAGFIWSSTYNTCYSVNIDPVPWNLAEIMCLKQGGHLASIQDSAQNSYIYSMVRSLNAKRVWIGAEVYAHRWMFSDGSSLIYQNFKGSISDPYSHSVGAMYINSNQSNGYWDIQPDTQSVAYPYICETPQCLPNGSPPPSLLQNASLPGMVYGPVSKKFFYGSGSNKLYLKDAKAWCAGKGGYLVSISNAYENQEVLQMVTTILGTNNPSMFEITIGYQSDLKGIWTWMDGNPSTYQNWDIGEPFMSMQMFGTMNLYAGKWKAAEDFLPRYFLCEFLTTNTEVCF